MKRLLFLTLIVLIAAQFAVAQTINGAGATFPYPVYSQWAFKYEQLNGVKLNYQSIGSGGGIQQIKAKTVDFGASDAPLTAQELDSVGLIQFPMIMGGVVPVVNIAGTGAGQLKMDAALLADIYLGKVTKWNDPRIMKLNKDLKLPNLAITAVYRSDGSGTTWIYTNYLTAVSADWKEKVGAGKAVSWPVGVGGKGNEGVAAFVQQTAGSIGYVEYAYALQNRLSYIMLQNRNGKFVTPTAESFMAAAEGADWEHTPGFRVVLVDQPGDKSWPITGASFILIYKAQTDAAQARAMLGFFDWCYKNGKEIALGLDYVPMPDKIVTLVESRWTSDIRSGSNAVWGK